ncbi:MAG: glutamine amidotransferase, partial [Mesorhizobium sp.]|uniref:type 1 glutamine amidotransferase n=1 Tax=Mesorhizobium sp. TaxID=1871066 RepID=UPI0012265E78
MKRIVLVRHSEEPGDDHVQTTLEANGHAVATAMPFKGEAIDLENVDGAVIYGGPFNVFDTNTHPFLGHEAALIEHCLDNDLPLLGICQGAQQIAWHLGAEVGPVESGIREFGYFEIMPTA